jgi:hypothetical protein
MEQTCAIYLHNHESNLCILNEMQFQIVVALFVVYLGYS